MILRDLGIVFVHVPKAAGTSIEFALTRRRFSAGEPPDHDVGWGWNADHGVWMQHATPDEMVACGLVTPDELRTAFTFTITRNPFDRAVSDYYFLRRHLGVRGSFKEMIEADGPWRRLLTDRTQPTYRGDHLRPQIDYLTLDGTPVIDHVGRLEALDETYAVLEARLGRVLPRPHHKPGPSRFEHYSHFYSDDEVELVAAAYADDLDRLDYAFEDRRTTRTRRSRRAMRVRLAADSVPNVARRGMHRMYTTGRTLARRGQTS